MAAETYEMSVSLDEYASESLCNISYYAVSNFCSSSLPFEDILVLCNWKVQKKNSVACLAHWNK
jgi:hypothetical protein